VGLELKRKAQSSPPNQPNPNLNPTPTLSIRFHHLCLQPAAASAQSARLPTCDAQAAVPPPPPRPPLPPPPSPRARPYHLRRRAHAPTSSSAAARPLLPPPPAGVPCLLLRRLHRSLLCLIPRSPDLPRPRPLPPPPPAPTSWRRLGVRLPPRRGGTPPPSA